MLVKAIAVELVGVDEEVDADVAVDDGKTESNREAGDVTAADVEQPVDRFGLREQGGVQPLLPQLAGNGFALAQAALAAVLLVVQQHLGLAGGRAVLPVQVDGILLQGDQGDLFLRQGRAGIAEPGEAVQPGIGADLLPAIQLAE